MPYGNMEGQEHDWCSGLLIVDYYQRSFHSWTQTLV